MTPTPQSSDFINKLKQVEIFKEKIATKVAQVRDEDKAAVSGEIKSNEKNTLILNTMEGEKKISYSEDTLIYKLERDTRKEGKTDELKKGITISALGHFNENKDSILAKYIYLENNLVRITGKIADLDKSSFSLTVKAKEADLTIDIEKYTKSSLYQKGKPLQKIGFSKFNLGDTIFAMATKNPGENNRYSAERLIIFPVSINPSPSPTGSPSPKPQK